MSLTRSLPLIDVLGNVRMLIALSLIFLCGCLDSNGLPNLATYPVKGQVLLADGKPLSTGRVYFHRQEEPPIRVSGEIGSDGRFELTTRSPGDGAPEGHYRIEIDPTPSNPSGSAPRVKPARVPSKYTNEGGSDLVVTVQAKPNELEPFRLK